MTSPEITQLKGTAIFTVQDWAETTYFDGEGQAPSLSKAVISKAYSGDFLGESSTTYLLVHHPDGRADFTGHERITCTIDAKHGSFVLRHDGTFEDGIASAACFIVADTGTGALANIAGAGYFRADGKKADFVFEFDV